MKTKERLYERIVKDIEKKIILGEYKTGERLPTERVLTENYKVNRSTIREALKRLETMGFIVIRHGSGLYVQNFLESANIEIIYSIIDNNSPITSDILFQLLEIRKIIVPKMAAFCAQRRSDEDVQNLETLVFSEDLQIGEKDARIHRLIAKGANNYVYLLLLNFLNKIIIGYGTEYFQNEENIKTTSQFHMNILDAIKDKNPEKAARIMESVIQYAENYLISVYSGR